MTSSLRAGAIAILATAVGLALAACGSGDSGGASTQSQTTSSSTAPSTTAQASAPSPAAPAPPAAPAYTIVDYIRDNGITETPVRADTPGAPTVELPIPTGWTDAGPRTPEGAYRALIFTADPAMAENPPTITAIMSKLTGNVDPAEVLKAAPGEIKNLPAYENMGDGNPSKLSGFDAYQIGGAYTKDGVKRVVAQKTVVIPTDGAVYVLQMNAEGTEDQLPPLLDATSAIDDQAKITV